MLNSLGDSVAYAVCVHCERARACDIDAPAAVLCAVRNTLIRFFYTVFHRPLIETDHLGSDDVRYLIHVGPMQQAMHKMHTRECCSIALIIFCCLRYCCWFVWLWWKIKKKKTEVAMSTQWPT